MYAIFVWVELSNFYADMINVIFKMIFQIEIMELCNLMTG